MPKKKPGAGGRRKQLLYGDWLDPQLERVLLEVFGRFDVDGDNALNEAELQAFAAACNHGEALPPDELQQIAEYFEITDAGALTKGGFFQMVYMQTVSRPQDTWNDLKGVLFTYAISFTVDLTYKPVCFLLERPHSARVRRDPCATDQARRAQRVRRCGHSGRNSKCHRFGDRA